MNKNIIYVTAAVIYLIAINLIFNVVSTPKGNIIDISQDQKNGGTQVQLGVSDTVSVSVVRPRAYGTYHEVSYARGSVVSLYVLKYIKLPIKAYSLNFVFAHVIFICGLSYYIYSQRRPKHEKNIQSTDYNRN